jgi:membrane associated rhomboid family serine protease
VNREAREYWRQQRRLNAGYRPPWSRGMELTTTLIGLMVVGWAVQQFMPGILFFVAGLPGGALLAVILSTILPGSFLGLIFAGIFVWILGNQLEGSIESWQYLLVFFGGGAVGNALSGLVSGSLGFSQSFAMFALAGAYAVLLARWAGRGPTMQWVLVLLLLNVLFTGLNPAALAGMAGGFAAGAGILYGSQSRPRRRRWP